MLGLALPNWTVHFTKIMRTVVASRPSCISVPFMASIPSHSIHVSCMFRAADRTRQGSFRHFPNIDTIQYHPIVAITLYRIVLSAPLGRNVTSGKRPRVDRFRRPHPPPGQHQLVRLSTLERQAKKTCMVDPPRRTIQPPTDPTRSATNTRPLYVIAVHGQYSTAIS